MNEIVNNYKPFSGLKFDRAIRHVIRAGTARPSLNVPRYRLVYVESGSASYRLAGRPVRIKTGDIVLMTPGKRSIEVMPGTDLIINNIGFRIEDAGFPDEPAVITSRSRPYPLLRELIVEMTVGNGDNKGRIFPLVLELYLQMAVEQKGQGDDLKLCISQYIDENIHAQLDVANLAQKFSFSEGYFRKLFRKLFAVGPKEYIRTRRLNYAIELMRDNELNLKEIAFASGYGSSQDFSRQFKELTGYSPRDYRAQLQPDTQQQN